MCVSTSSSRTSSAKTRVVVATAAITTGENSQDILPLSPYEIQEEKEDS